MSTSDIIVDESCFPLVFLTFPPQVDAEMVTKFCARYDRMLDRGRPFANVTDVTLVTERPAATIRKQLAEWSRSNDARMVKLSRGDARVVRSSLIRGAMTAVGWLHKPKTPEEWFSSKEDAIAWAIKQLDDARVPIPSAVRERFTMRTAT
ncbi:MAG: hypothetical protein JNK04_10385 [Myxococcales bacterium]|nr:hypothetical protein [Myxococcales bacterium]